MSRLCMADRTSQDRGDFQGLCAGAARCLLARQTTRRNAAIDKRIAVMRVTVSTTRRQFTSVLKALRHLGSEPEVTDGDLTLVGNAERIVLPGVGHFQATERLDATGLTPAIRAASRVACPFSAFVWACSGFLRVKRSSRSIRPRAFQ